MARRIARQVAVIIDGSKPYDRKVIGGIGTYAQRGRWSLYVEENPLQKLSVLRTHRWDGVIANFDERKIASVVAGMNVPVVGVGGSYGWYDRGSGIPYVAVDDEAVSRLAFEHLLERGFTQFAYCGFARTPVNGWSADRARSFRTLAQQAGYRSAIYSGRYATMRNWEQLQDELAGWLAGLPKPVGLMACNDPRARHVLEACRRIGVRVPEDVAVVSVDDDSVLCELTDPPLTSIDQDGHRVGETAAEVLEELMAGKRPRRRWFVVKPKSLVARRSSDVIAVKDSDVAAALRFIHDHACDGIHADDVAGCVTVARITLERRFQALLGRSVHAEIQRVRMGRARCLVAETNTPLKQIGAMIGVKQRTYFTVVFRQHFGCTPAEYRRRR
jgi:LacI family transcriptional regulator